MTVKTDEMVALKSFPSFSAYRRSMGLISSMLACEQALWRALAAGGKGGRAFNYVSGI